MVQADRSNIRTDRLTEQSIQSLLNVIEVRRGIEEAIAAGSGGVEEDTKFHQSIAVATGNLPIVCAS